MLCLIESLTPAIMSQKQVYAALQWHCGEIQASVDTVSSCWRKQEKALAASLALTEVALWRTTTNFLDRNTEKRILLSIGVQ